MPWAACLVRLDTECVALLLYRRQLRLWLRDLARHQLGKLRHHLLREHGHLLHRWRKRTLVEFRCLSYQQERKQHNHPAGVTRPPIHSNASASACCAHLASAMEAEPGPIPTAGTSEQRQHIQEEVPPDCWETHRAALLAVAASVWSRRPSVTALLSLKSWPVVSGLRSRCTHFLK